MKTLKCPLCGNELTSIFRMTKTGSLKNKYGCLLCGWETFELRKNENLAWKDAKEFISKFPPIMRVWPGDKLQVEDGSICEVINVNKNLAMMDVRRGEGRPVFMIADNHVIRWPWELEQKGGDNGQ